MIKEYTKDTDLRISDNCPTTGQFVAVWEHNNKIWAHTYKWLENDLYVYDKDKISGMGTFMVIPFHGTYPWMSNPECIVKFYIKAT